MDDSDLFADCTSSDSDDYHHYDDDTSDVFEPYDPLCYICGYDIGVALGLGWSVAGMKKAKPAWCVYGPRTDQ